jgi:excisionase family DNA binding protein
MNGDGKHELMTVKEVARLFRRSERTIREWVRKGRLKPVRIGRSVYFLRSEVERLLED